jgi:hypothetical protein
VPNFNTIFIDAIIIILEPDPLEDKVTQEELAAVNGDISAVYIIRIINKRAEALKKLKTEAMAKIPDGFAINKEFNKANKPDEETDAVHDDQQKLNKAKKGKKDKTVGLLFWWRYCDMA